MRTQLRQMVHGISSAAIAVSGGVDSMTLAAFCHRELGDEHVTMMHAVSPAVPPEATARVRTWAAREGWRLEVLDAREFEDENYRANPLNRCFFCKTNLYGAMAAFTSRQLLSGTNTDDLGEYRPGLEAARDFGVRHPYVEAGAGKQEVRALARELDLGELAELPPSPCLSSRVETLIRIEPDHLGVIHAVERLVGLRLRPKTVRCRIRRSGIVIELDAESLALVSGQRRDLTAAIAGMLPERLSRMPLSFDSYRTGSAFVGAK